MSTQLAATWRLGSIGGLAVLAHPPAAPVVTAPPLAPPQPKRGWRWPLLWVSAGLHIVVLLVLLISPPERPPEDGLGAPSVSVILGPTTDAPTSTAPTPQAATGLPDAPTAQPSAPPDLTRGERVPDASASAVPPQPAAAQSPPATDQPVAPPPPVAAFAPPAPPVAASPAAAASATAESDTALPVPPVPPSAAPPAPAPAPPRTQEALLQPLLRPSPQPPVRAPERQATRPSAAHPPAPRREGAPDGFPMPAFASLGGALANSARPSREPSREMAGPVRISSSNSFRPQFDLSGDDLGPGWNRLIHDWIERHKYYPHEAAENGEEGVAAVTVVLGRDGHVRSVNLVQRSGSQWLDLGLQALFRSQNLPPIPDNIHESQATINIQMHYILIR